MKEESLNLIKKAITNWRGQIRFTYEMKDISSSKSPILDGEYILRFHNSLKGFYCKCQEIPIFLSSQLFHTTTLSDATLSENPNADRYRLEKLLEEFDYEFYKLIDTKLTECEELLFTSENLFF
jgi:hypothetical protein